MQLQGNTKILGVFTMKIDVTKLTNVELYELIDEAIEEKRVRRERTIKGHAKSFDKDGIRYTVEYTYDVEALSTALQKRLANTKVRIASEQAKAKAITEQAPKTIIKCWRSKVIK